MSILFLLAAASTSAEHPSFSVAGVKLGMMTEQVTAALTALGYRSIRTGFTDSYEQRLRDAAALQLGHQSLGHDQNVGVITASQTGQEVSVDFADDATGRRIVASVRYKAPGLAKSIAEVGPTLVERFGPPTTMRSYGAAWCLDPDPGDCDVGAIGRSDQLTLRAESDMHEDVTTVELDAGQTTRRSWSDAFRRRVRDLIASPAAF